MTPADIAPAFWAAGVNVSRDRLIGEASNLDQRQAWEPDAYFQAVLLFQVANASAVAEHVYLRHCEDITDLRSAWWNGDAPANIPPQFAAFREASIATLAGLLADVAKLSPESAPDLVLTNGLTANQVRDLEAVTREGFAGRLRYLMDHAYQRGTA